MTNSKWIYPNVNIDELRNHPMLTNIGDMTLKILYNRGFKDPNTIYSFLNGEIKDLHDPRLLKDADKATDIIIKAIKNNEFIVIYGDYDCDGVSATAVMTELLQKAGARVGYYTNNRFTQGYGIVSSGIDEILNMYPETKLIITVDNGITAFEGIEYAKQNGLKVIVTDHHEQGSQLPNADAIVNPKRKDCNYPFKGLCGAGVAFKLMLLMYFKMEKPLETVYKTLDIVAMATVGDIVPLLDENRIIVQKGLNMIREENRLVFKALRDAFQVSDINAHYTLAFQYVPAINSIGRIEGNPREAIHMFFEDDYDKIQEIIHHLIEVNEKRKDMTTSQCEEAKKIIDEKELDQVIVVYHPSFHEGIIGLIASRLKELYHRPVFVFAENQDGILKGSGRSIDGLHLKDDILDVLSSENVILSGGGHAKACGLSISKDKLKDFKNRVNEIAKSKLTEDDFIKKYHIDYVFHPNEITLDTIDELRTLEPFGESFPKPLLVIDDFNVDRTFYMGKNKNHLKLTSPNLDVVMFQEAKHYQILGEPKKVRAIGYLNINIWNNAVYIQFLVEGNNLQPA